MYPVLKLITLIFWGVFAYNTFQPIADPTGSIIAWVGIILAVVHLLEYVLKKNALEDIGAGGLHGLCQTLIYGFLYWLPLLKNSASAKEK